MAWHSISSGKSGGRKIPASATSLVDQTMSPVLVTARPHDYLGRAVPRVSPGKMSRRDGTAYPFGLDVEEVPKSSCFLATRQPRSNSS